MKTSHTFAKLTLVIALSLLAFQATHAAPSSAARARRTRPQDTAGDVTKANWRQHPKIREIRAIVQAVNSSMARKALKIRKRAFEYCEPYEDVSRTIATDASGRVRFYANEGGSDDSALKWEHYYDETGRLRFVLITGGAVNGSKLEHRIYFDASGKRIWEEQTYTKGPGYTFPEVWPDDQLQMSDAASKFDSKSQCPETKARKGGKRT